MPDEPLILEIKPDLDPAHVARLQQVLDVEPDELAARFGQLAAAALTEYVLAFTATRAPSTIKELRELRLRLLFDHLPDGQPTDEQIGQLFQMTPSQVATLIAGTRARFEEHLSKRLQAAAVTALTHDAKRVDDDTVRIVVADSLARYLRDLVARTSAMPMDKRKDASRTYDLGRGTVRALCDQLGIAPESVTALEWKQGK